jgi:rhodanese-related sulfurtransferase
MKENSNTKSLVIGVLIFVGVLLIGFLFSKSSSLPFKLSPQATIDYLMEADYQILPEDVDYYVEFEEPGYVYVDIRNPYEFAKGNIATSVNIPQTDLLQEESLAFFDAAQHDSLTVVLIHKDEASVTGPWLILKQLGYDNLMAMKGGWNYYANESLDPYDMPEVPKYMVEEPAYDFVAIMEMMQASPAAASDDAPEVVLPTRKKKKNVIEGGC